MNKQDMKLLQDLNAELERLGVNARVSPHQHYPFRKIFVYSPKGLRLVRVFLATRKVDIFTYDSPDSSMGSSEHIGGPFRGRGWVQYLAQAVAHAIKRLRRAELRDVGIDPDKPIVELTPEEIQIVRGMS